MDEKQRRAIGRGIKRAWKMKKGKKSCRCSPKRYCSYCGKKIG